MRVPGVSVVLFGLLLAAGCGDDTPTEPAACTNLGGAWKVEFHDSCGRRWSDPVVTITQSGCSYRAVGTLLPYSFDGTIAGDSVTIRISFGGSCPGTASGTGTIHLGGVDGTYAGSMTGGDGCCAGPMDGAFSLLPPR
jgi:hypothetical protein